MTVQEICANAADQALKLQSATTEYKNSLLAVIATALTDNVKAILSANTEDVQSAREKGKPDSFIDRLTLTPARINDMAEGVRQIIALPDPVGEITREWDSMDGLHLRRVRMPIGVIAIIYEARPNVTVDALALCIKSGNAVVLRGSRDAMNSNLALYNIITCALAREGYPTGLIGMIQSPSYDATLELLHQKDYVDVVIPRGGNTLKDYVLENAKMPVIASAGGNCHIFVDETADTDMATAIIVNAKVQRPSTCNAAEQLLIHRAIATKYLPEIFAALSAQGVTVVGSAECVSICPDMGLATDEDYYTEHQSLKMSVAIVADVTEAISRVNTHGTRHSEAIITENTANANAFMYGVDAAAVYHNASTRFTDGFRFGYGAEMGISTGKLHVRGPIGLEALTTERVFAYGHGNIRRS